MLIIELLFVLLFFIIKRRKENKHMERVIKVTRYAPLRAILNRTVARGCFTRKMATGGYTAQHSRNKTIMFNAKPKYIGIDYEQLDLFTMAANSDEEPKEYMLNIGDTVYRVHLDMVETLTVDSCFRYIPYGNSDNEQDNRYTLKYNNKNIYDCIGEKDLNVNTFTNKVAAERLAAKNAPLIVKKTLDLSAMECTLCYRSYNEHLKRYQYAIVCSADDDFYYWEDYCTYKFYEKLSKKELKEIVRRIMFNGVNAEKIPFSEYPEKAPVLYYVKDDKYASLTYAEDNGIISESVVTANKNYGTAPLREHKGAKNNL